MATATRPAASRATNPAERLRRSMAAVRVSFTWFGTRKSLTAEQKTEAADTFGAEGPFLSAGKRLLDTRHSAFRAVSAVRSRTLGYWRAVSLPFPEPGIRLIRQDSLDAFQQQMAEFRDELNAAVEELDGHYAALKASAREQLGRLYNPADYPVSLLGLFAMSWDFPSVEAPSYLRELSPELYEQETQRVQARFEQAVELAEQAFTEELAKLVSHLTERLSGDDDGKPKVFRDTAVENLSDFFDRFRSLNVRSSDQLEQLVEQCRSIIRGASPQKLRDSTALRQQVATQLASVGSVLDGLLVERPRRRILRTAK